MELCPICQQAAPFKCTSCKSIHYCGAEHQKKHWPKHKANCRPFKIERSDKLGRYVVATRDIPAKSVIFIEPPLVVGPKWCSGDDEKSSPLFPCVGCFRSTPINANRCPKCSWPVCRPDCVGLNDPQMHGLECCVLSTNVGPGAGSDRDRLAAFYRKDVLLTLRCLLLQWKYAERWNKVMLLESHDQQRLGTRYYHEADERIVSYLVEHFWPALDRVESELGSRIVEKRDRKLLHRICGIMEVNALNIGLGFEDAEVSALFENACILEHSCVPNCYYTFDVRRQFRITLRAGRLIRRGEHLAIMYTNMLWGTLLRQEHLLANKYFVCECERCTDATELGTHVSSMKCIGDIGKDCGGTLLPTNPIDTATDWQCDRCAVSIANDQIEIILTNIESEVDDLLLPSGASTITAAAIEALIDKLSHLLHDNHYHLFALKHTLIQFYGHQPNFRLDELSDAILQRKIALCEQLLWILDRIDAHTMRLTMYTGVVLYELHAAVLEQHRRLGDSASVDVLHVAQQYLRRGKEAVSLNADISQGRKLVESFERAEQHVHAILQKHTD